MYIDYRKFNYSKYGLDKGKTKREKRDKTYFKKNFINWVKENIEDVANRQWEIDDIGFIERSGEFIKLIKEAEFCYSIACYTSAIALSGVASEDLSRFYSSLCGKNYDNLEQYNRTNNLLQDGLISQNIHDLLHEIRGIRNDCLHFNEGFKQKDKSELKNDALKAINNLKLIYKELIGQSEDREFNFENLNKIISNLASEASGDSGEVLNVGDVISRIRNIFSDFTGIDLSIETNHKKIIKESLYKILEIDMHIEPPEITLQDESAGTSVIVDLTSDNIEKIKQQQIQRGDIVIASIVSELNEIGMSTSWNCRSIEKIS